jgi:hypothetical protein
MSIVPEALPYTKLLKRTACTANQNVRVNLRCFTNVKTKTITNTQYINIMGLLTTRHSDMECLWRLPDSLSYCQAAAMLSHVRYHHKTDHCVMGSWTRPCPASWKADWASRTGSLLCSEESDGSIQLVGLANGRVLLATSGRWKSACHLRQTCTWAHFHVRQV